MNTPDEGIEHASPSRSWSPFPNSTKLPFTSVKISGVAIGDLIGEIELLFDDEIGSFQGYSIVLARVQLARRPQAQEFAAIPAFRNGVIDRHVFDEGELASFGEVLCKFRNRVRKLGSVEQRFDRKDEIDGGHRERSVEAVRHELCLRRNAQSLRFVTGDTNLIGAQTQSNQFGLRGNARERKESCPKTAPHIQSAKVAFR